MLCYTNWVTSECRPCLPGDTRWHSGPTVFLRTKDQESCGVVSKTPVGNIPQMDWKHMIESLLCVKGSGFHSAGQGTVCKTIVGSAFIYILFSQLFLNKDCKPALFDWLEVKKCTKILKSSKSWNLRWWKHVNKSLKLSCHEETLLFWYTVMSLMSCDFKVAHFKSRTVHTHRKLQSWWSACEWCCCELDRPRAHQQTSERCRRSSRSPEGWCNPLRGLCWRPFRQPRAGPDPQPAVCRSVCTQPCRAGTVRTDRTRRTTEGSERGKSPQFFFFFHLTVLWCLISTLKKRNTFQSDYLKFSVAGILSRIAPTAFVLSQQQHKQWQEISYGIIAHNAKLLWQHEAAPADQGLAAGGPLTPLLEPLSSSTVRQELGQPRCDTTASAELGSLFSHTHTHTHTHTKWCSFPFMSEWENHVTGI